MKYLKLIEEESPDVDDMDKERYVTSLRMILARKSKKKKGFNFNIFYSFMNSADVSSLRRNHQIVPA